MCIFYRVFSSFLLFTWPHQYNNLTLVTSNISFISHLCATAEHLTVSFSVAAVYRNSGCTSHASVSSTSQGNPPIEKEASYLSRFSWCCSHSSTDSSLHSSFSIENFSQVSPPPLHCSPSRALFCLDSLTNSATCASGTNKVKLSCLVDILLS